MTLNERRSVQRRGWIGLLALTALPVGGVTLLSGRMSLFFVAMVAALLSIAFAAGFVILCADLRARAESRRVPVTAKLP